MMIVSGPATDSFWASKLGELKSEVHALQGDRSWDRKMRIQSCLDEMLHLFPLKEDPASLMQLKLRCKELTEVQTFLSETEPSGIKRSRCATSITSVIESIRQLFQTQLLDVATSINSSLFILIPSEELITENIPLFKKIFQSMTLSQRNQFFSGLGKINPSDRIPFLKSSLFYYNLSGYHNETQTNFLLESLKFGNSGLHLAIIANQFIKEMLSNPEIDVNLPDHQGCTPLHLAVVTPCIETIKQLLAHPKIELNKRTPQGRTPLHFASCATTATLLIRKGANSRILDLYGNSCYMTLKAKGVEPPPVMAKDRLGHTLKMAALIWGLAGYAQLPGQRIFTLHGGKCASALGQLIGALSSIPKSVQDAFLVPSKGQELDHYLNSIKQNKLTVIPCGFLQHMMYLVIYKNILFICNRGAGSERGSFCCYQINPKKISLSTLKTISMLSVQPQSIAVQMYYHELPTHLSDRDTPQEITHIFSDWLEPKKQKVGNCPASSAKLAIRASLAGIAFKEHGETLTEDRAIQVLAQSKAATRELREISYFAFKEEGDKIKDPMIKNSLFNLFETKREEYEIYDPDYDDIIGLTGEGNSKDLI